MVFCDRDHPYFDGDDNLTLQTLHRVLLAHTILDPELGCAQKMIDVMSSADHHHDGRRGQ
jgi:hypothetical protein